MGNFAFILASGAGTRAGGDVPKQFRLVAGRPLFYWSMRAFASCPGLSIVAVVHKDYHDLWRDFWNSLPEDERIPHALIPGGGSRIDSVREGLRFVAAGLPASDSTADDIFVAVHDAARPLVTPRIIADAFAVAESRGVVAVPATPVSDSLRTLSAESPGNGTSETVPVDRSRFRVVQTPQVAPLSWLLKGYSLPTQTYHTDDASILQDAGYPVALVDGDPSNMKVTAPTDFIVAEALLRAAHNIDKGAE